MKLFERTTDHGLLLLRLGLGGMFVAHGWPKLAGGAKSWVKIGGAMTRLGIDLWPTMWGFLAACSEFFGGLLIALGLFFRPGAAMLLATMVVASVMHLQDGDGFTKSSHAIEAAIVFAALILIGPGRFAVQRRGK
jgi:putative oxidoreductase